MNQRELKTAIGKEAGGTPRWHEQLGYAYDAAGNVNYKTNNALVEAFNVNNLNQLSTLGRSGTLTVSGTTTTSATNVTVNTSNTILYADATFAATNMQYGHSTNTYTAVAQDGYGRISSNTVSAWLPAAPTYVYDLNGNMLLEENSPGTITNRNFAYDDENQLIAVWGNSWSNSFVYDGKFRRRIERDYVWSSAIGNWQLTNEVRYVYDGNVVIQERNAANVPLVSYTRSGSTLLARTDYGQEIPGAPATAYYHLDGNANVTMLIYANQIIAARYFYDPYGNALSLSGSLASLNVYRFASKEWNSSAGIYNFGRRYYDPILQRFINRDPIAEQGGINLYAYVGNNPINLIDLLGLCPPSLWDQWWLDMYDNSLSDLEGIGAREGYDLANLLEQTAQSSVNFALNPFGSTYNQIVGFSQWAGNVSLDPSGYSENVINQALTSLTTRDGLTDFSFAMAVFGLGGEFSELGTVDRLAIETPPSLDALSQAAGAADRGGLTAAGRSLTKHGIGARAGNALFPAAEGNPETINQTAQNVVDDILTTPGSTIQNGYKGRFGPTIEVTAPDGRRLIYDAKGKFIYFWE